MRVGDPAVDLGTRWTYRHYRTWPEDERWELIDGEACDMRAAPSLAHQRIVGTLYFRIRAWLEEHGLRCEAIIAPADVLLPRGDEADDEVDSVVQPDLSVVCDASKLRDDFVRGAPDLAVEVLSPWTSAKDQRQKYWLYERSGVREYWTVDPGLRCVRRYVLEGGRYGDGELFLADGRVESRVLAAPDGGSPFAVGCRELFDLPAASASAAPSVPGSAIPNPD